MTTTRARERNVRAQYPSKPTVRGPADILRHVPRMIRTADASYAEGWNTVYAISRQQGNGVMESVCWANWSTREYA